MDEQDEGARVGLWVVLGIITLLLFGLIGGLVRVFFDLDKAELQPDAPTALAPAVQALAEAPSKKLIIAGFHDPSGDAAHNADLARRRAIAVRLALIALGADGTHVLLRKPEQTALGGPPEEARRVEVRLVD